MKSSTYLLTGAAGYVGSHVLQHFLEQGQSCVVLDNLSKGHREAVPAEIPFFQGDLSNPKVLTEIFQAYAISGILHFAGFIEVGESMENPGKYFENNIAQAISLLDLASKHQVPWIVFSSSAAVYGEPEKNPIEESAPPRPNNPYGQSKWIFEEILKSYRHAFGLRSISLRYFNAAGAHPSGNLGENHTPETHLIPLACKAALGSIGQLYLYGDDYATPDGTCIRDYVHILDLAEAHLFAVKALENNHVGGYYNIGAEKGYSVKKVIQSVENVSGKKIPVEIKKKRAGDSSVLVASSKKFKEEFGWTPKFQSLEKIIETAWKWHERQRSDKPCFDKLSAPSAAP